MTRITVRHDLRGLLGPVRDQGTRGTCLAFAMSDGHGCALGLPWTPLSCEYLFYQAKQRDGTSAHLGTTVPAIRAALAQDGQPVEAAWPYLKALPSDLTQWIPPTNIGQILCRGSNGNGALFSDLWALIEAAQPVVVGMTLSTAFLAPSLGGVVDSSEPEEPSIRHAVLAVGTGQRGHQRFILMRNSWGVTWGDAGYGWLSEEYLTRRIKAMVTLN